MNNNIKKRPPEYESPVKLMRRTAVIFLLLVLMYPTIQTGYAEDKDKDPSREINVVYDDSKSMFLGDNDTWCRAKYSMEVCAAMLGENDTMNIFVMSDFDKGAKGKVKLKLRGKDGAKANVQKVHEMHTFGKNTPIASVESAYNDIIESKAAERWLLILTDGDFEYGPDDTIPSEDVQSIFDNMKGNGVKIMLLSMGDGAEPDADPDKGFYFKKARNSKDILNSITDISKQLVNANEIEVNGDNEMNFAVPMKEIIIFAQGKDCQIGGILPSGEGTQQEMADVKYSTKATDEKEYDGKVKVAKDLVGKVVTYKGYFPIGKYTVSVTDAENVTVFYKPDIDIRATVDGDANLNDIEAGTHEVSLELADGKTGKIIKESSDTQDLLGKLDYQVRITSKDPVTGNVETQEFSDKEFSYSFKEGDLTIDADAVFLDYNHAATTEKYYIFKNKKIELEVEENPKFVITSVGIDNGDKPLIVKATLEGKDFTEEQWKSFTEKGKPKISVKAIGDEAEKMGELTARFGKEPGAIEVLPSLPDGKPEMGTYTPFDFALKVSNEVDVGNIQSAKEKWTGKADLKMNIADGRNFFQRYRDYIIATIGLLLLLILVNGYLPWRFGKKYLPRKLKPSPKITCRPTGEMAAVAKTKTAYGSFVKDKHTTFIPYMAETGSIRFVPQGKNVKTLSVKGDNSGYMYIMNTKSFAGNKKIFFNSQNIESGTTKPMRVTGGLSTEYRTPYWIYTSDLNEGKK